MSTTEAPAETGSKVPEGAGAGVMIGGALGGIVAAATTIAGAMVTGGIVLPLIAGPLTTILAGMGAGGLVGGIIGALVGAGIPEERAHEIGAGSEQGGIRAGVSPRDENRRRVSEILSTPVDRRVRAETGEVEPTEVEPTEFTPEATTDIPPRRTVS